MAGKGSKKKILIIGAVVVVVAILVVANLTMDNTNAMSVQTDQASDREIVEIVSASGRIQPKSKVDITSEVNGEIIGLYVREGDRIAAGELLIVLDTVRLRSDVDQGRYAVNETNARLEGAKASLEQADEEYNRQKRLFESNLTSETEYKNARYAYLNAKASHQASQAQSSQLRAMYDQKLDNLEKAKIIAPMPGVITFLDCEIGEIAAAQTAFTQGRTLMTISDLEIFEVEVEVDETEINKVELGQHSDIEVDAFPDSVFVGEVVEIGNTAIQTGLGTTDQTTNFRVKVVFKDTDVKIRTGMSATVDITTNKRGGVLSIPYSAVVVRSFDLDSLEMARANEGGGNSSEVFADEAGEEDTAFSTGDEEEEKREELKGVFVVRDGKARFVQIETGIADQKYIQVTEGLEDGDEVISGPYRILRTVKDGDDVQSQSDSKRDREKA